MSFKKFLLPILKGKKLFQGYALLGVEGSLKEKVSRRTGQKDWEVAKEKGALLCRRQARFFVFAFREREQRDGKRVGRAVINAAI